MDIKKSHRISFFLQNTRLFLDVVFEIIIMVTLFLSPETLAIPSGRRAEMLEPSTMPSAYPAGLPVRSNAQWRAEYEQCLTPNYGTRRLAIVRGPLLSP